MGLFDIFTGDSAEEAAAKNAALYNDYKNQGLGILDQTLPQQTGAINQGIGLFSGLSGKYGKATDLYQDALGVNGAAGNARATAAFQAAPGYQFGLNQAIDQATRAANATGTATGNIIDEVTNRAGQYANQNYNSWLTNLGGFVNPELSATGGAASGYNTLAGAYGQNASDKINLIGNATSGTANSNTQAANSEMQASGNFWNGLMNLGGAVAKGYWGGAK